MSIDTLLTILHVMAALVLVVVVLLQHGKGADVGAAFGGGASQTVFGSRGAGNFLTKMTTGFVVLFMITSVSLAIRSAPTSVFDDIEPAPGDSQPAGSFPEATPIEDGDSLIPEGFEAAPAPAGSSAPDSGAPAAELPAPPTPDPTDAAPSSSSEEADSTPPAGSEATTGETTPSAP